jgi:predicted ATPase
MISSIGLRNFTAFTELDIELSPKINVIIGSNGTGKTHLLKAIYALALAGDLRLDATESGQDLDGVLSRKFLRLFMPIEGKFGALRSEGTRGPSLLRLAHADGTGAEISFTGRSERIRVKHGYAADEQVARPVFIPTKEVLSLARGIRHRDHDPATVEMIFDDTYVDLAKQLVCSGAEDAGTDPDQDPRVSSVMRGLVALVGGRYRWVEDGGFSFEAGSYRERADPDRSKAKAAQIYQDSTVTHFLAKGGRSLSSSMTAEGFRKIGVLNRLLSNGTIKPGTSGVLLWDEPEANLNPRLMKKLVQVLLELSRNGQQIVLATHDYVLLKWFDLLTDVGKEDHVKFHAFVRDISSQKLEMYSTDHYSGLSETAISRTFSDLYDAEIERSLDGVKL